MKAENRIDLNIDNKGKGRRFESRFLQAGLVKYSFGVCLLSKEVIDRFAYKFVGCPVIIDHKDITDANAKDERVGVISKVWYNEYDGWFWCEGVVFDDEAISLIKDKGYNVSCQYNIDDYTENTANALHNGNPYDLTILDGTPEHLAIVKNPRYEEALIAVNKGEDMKAENTEFRTGYDSEGDAYVYPLEGADDKKSGKKSDKKDDKKYDKKEDKKESKKSVIEKAEKDLSKNKFIPNSQKSILKKDLKGEEYEHFADKIEELSKTIENAPKMYETDGIKLEDKKPILHYFSGSYDNYVYEIDKSTGMMFGAVNMGYGYELGYSSMEEINSVPKIELDLYFDGKQPKELSNGKAKNALEEQLERFVSLIAKNFDESKHDRDKDGKFTDSGNFSGESVDEQEAKLVKELKRLEKNGQDVSEIYKKLTGKEWGKKEAKKEIKKENKPGKKSQKSDSVKFDKIGKVLTSILKDAEKSYKESK